ncbi:hypothetical protein CHRY9390_00910 [Chryseobacterium aquaeductus]|uniref:Uncharacterized protein n=1 Tax=Chryseobacterium aquaeductus TaxID=2675056 RepID=A0A9N8MEL8_9FLAO|nr:hypothetical protein [Chryseobacterium aquaeductus]CAA7330249.1 hypothetical protein CHRY9390_00910 [Chryseobacterium potabilaquae]CAD7802314.1 hypothetical protein CHRY9390_00910 [Chryseobacterium aquaeductus]
MVTKEQIENTVKEIIEIYPKLKEIIDNDFPWKIMKTDSAIMVDGRNGIFSPGWKCLITSVNENQFSQRGLISFTFDEKGEPKEIMVSDMGRPSFYKLSRDSNGNIVALD